MDRESGSWTRRGAVALVLALCLVVVGTTGAGAQPTIDVRVDGSSANDGESVTVDRSPTVNVTISSTVDLNYVEIRFGNRIISQGVDSRTFTMEHSPELEFGRTQYTVTAEDVEGRATTHEVSLHRPAETRAEIREQLEQIRSDLRNLEAQNQRLERERENLSAENERLRQQINESGGGSGGEGLPGPGIVLGLLAVLVGAGWARRQ